MGLGFAQEDPRLDPVAGRRTDLVSMNGVVLALAFAGSRGPRLLAGEARSALAEESGDALPGVLAAKGGGEAALLRFDARI